MWEHLSEELNYNMFSPRDPNLTSDADMQGSLERGMPCAVTALMPNWVALTRLRNCRY
jgi:hypothetical protein